MTENKLLNVLESTEECNTLPAGEVIVGEFVGLSQIGEPLVNFVLNRQGRPIAALSTSSLTQRHIGRKVVLMFVDGDLSKPLIVGLVYSPLHEVIENFELAAFQTEATPKTDDSVSTSVGTEHDMHVDGRKVTFEAKEEIVLKCGDASITLNKSGKISIRGKYLLNRATGVNRILGGSVQVN